MIKKWLQRWLEIPVTSPSSRRTVPDVPRTANGWPVPGPEYFTLPQLVLEARKWREGWPGTVGGEEWKKYTDELVRRGYSTRLEIENGLLPHEVPRRTRPDWLWQLEGI